MKKFFLFFKRHQNNLDPVKQIKIYNWLIRVVASCTTFEQWVTAQRLCRGFIRDNEMTVYSDHIRYRLREVLRMVDKSDEIVITRTH
jgi:hypothetical protein